MELARMSIFCFSAQRSYPFPFPVRSLASMSIRSSICFPVYWVLERLEMWTQCPESDASSVASVYSGPNVSSRMKRFPPGGFMLICVARLILHPASSRSCISASTPSVRSRRAASIVIRKISRWEIPAFCPSHWSYVTLWLVGSQMTEKQCCSQSWSLRAAITFPERHISQNFRDPSSAVAQKAMWLWNCICKGDFLIANDCL